MKHIWIVALLSIAVVLAACGSSQEASDFQQPPAPVKNVENILPPAVAPSLPPSPAKAEEEPQIPPPKLIPATNKVKSFSMTAKQFAFDPDTITVKKGDHVVLHIKSLDVTHGFALPDFGVNVPLTPGTEQTVEFDATKAGEFTFFCSIVCGSGHADMKGKLFVEG